MPSARPVTPSTGRIPPGVFALPFGILILLAGLWGGLARLGYTLPVASSSIAEHGFLMSLGFLGTLIATERAVALGRWWAWCVPALSVAGSAWVVFGSDPTVGYGLFCAAGLLLVGVYGRLHFIQASTHNTLMAVAAGGWAVAGLLAMLGRPAYDAVPWLAIFLVVTITAERLELSRMLKRSKPVRVSLVVAILVMVGGATVSIWATDIGIRIAGAAMVAMAIWLWLYDLARRTILARGVTRFMAAGLLAGYFWLAGGGLLWAIAGKQLGNSLYDAELHSIFLGFVMSMVFAHAPVIAPAVIRKPLPYYPAFYGPLALLHIALLLRVFAGDAAGVTLGWQIGGVLNEVAILAFVAVTVGAFVRAAAADRARRAALTGGYGAPAGASAGAAAAAGPAAAGAAAGAGAGTAAGPPAGATTGASSSAMAAAGPVRTPSGSAGVRRLPMVLGGAVGVLVVAAAVVLAIVGRPGDAGTASGPIKPGAHSDEVISAAEAAAGVPISLVEMKIIPAAITVAPGTHLVLKVTNNGTMFHDLKVGGTGQQTPILSPGQSATLDLGTVEASTQAWCTLPGHRQMGMNMFIDVARPGSASGAASPQGTAGPTTGGMAGMGSGDMPMTQSGQPDATSPDLSTAPPAGWKPIDASLPPAPNTTVHDVTWHIKDVKTEVAPGVTQTLWTFDGRSPGPVLRGKVGDRFNITVVNDTDMQHNIDFHAESGPPAKVMTPVDPGATHTYSFVATHAGAWLYHCSIEPMLMHLGNGMFGALIIDPPDLPPADAEFVLVGSELFFGPQGEPGDYDKMLADKADAVVFNGYPFAYQHQPLAAKVGDLVRVWVVDAGPSRPIGFHVVGAPFTTEYLNGAYLLKDGKSAGGQSGAAQTLPVDPGNGGFVELRFTEAGSYPFMSHAMADAAIGASGTFTVTK